MFRPLRGNFGSNQAAQRPYEPAYSLGDRSNATDGWLPSLTCGNARYAVVLVLAALVARCGRERIIAGDFRLEQWEDGKAYYLHKRDSGE
jgi:hypothetical protein